MKKDEKELERERDSRGKSPRRADERLLDKASVDALRDELLYGRVSGRPPSARTRSPNRDQEDRMAKIPYSYEGRNRDYKYGHEAHSVGTTDHGARIMSERLRELERQQLELLERSHHLEGRTGWGKKA